MKKKSVKNLPLFFLFLFFLLHGEAESQGLNSGALANLFVRAEEITGMSSHLLASVAARESAFNPWAVNIEGAGYHAKSKMEALEKTRESQAKSYDLGLMQINSWWLPKFGITDEQAIDPELNVILGSLILKDCIQTHQTIPAALSCYNTGNGTDGLNYAELVIKEWKRFSQ